MVFRHLVTSLLALVLFSVLTGILYPLAVTGLAQLIFPDKANGSLIRRNGKVLGSELIGQPFSDAKYFWGRPSSTSPYPYNAASSSASNTGPLNPSLLDETGGRVRELMKADSLNTRPIPVDLVTSSGSGLDPDISIASALYQLPRIARVRMLPPEAVRSVIDRNTEGRFLGILGEPRVNVLKMNLDLDEMQPHSEGK
ncbi:MAG TPA: potassium-transporting ATPase subunit KdpC [Bacteroidota bacterium]|nr:potassium-transporting ATPase subunit KdpC [Bacteroidota bacterium]